jgi:hypothetical protein
VIKFFCLSCRQKLAIEDEGIGVVVPCPRCRENIEVPPYSITEAEYRQRTLRPQPTPAAKLELIAPGDERAGNLPTPSDRAALIPHLARLMMNRLVQTLFAQRTSLLDTQADATQRMAELEERIVKAQANMQRKIAAYEVRIAELEQQLAAKVEESHDLRRANFRLAKKALEVEGVSPSSRVNLRDAGLLLHA